MTSFTFLIKKVYFGVLQVAWGFFLFDFRYFHKFADIQRNQMTIHLVRRGLAPVVSTIVLLEKVVPGSSAKDQLSTSLHLA